MKFYSVYGNDNDIRGGPIFSPYVIDTVKATSPSHAIRKVYQKSRRGLWGWRLGDLTARIERRNDAT